MSKPILNEKSRIYWQDRIELHDKKVEKDTLKLEKQLKTTQEELRKANCKIVEMKLKKKQDENSDLEVGDSND